MSNRHSEALADRLRRAQRSLDDAQLLADASSWNSSVNRLYYACFYAASALLLRGGWASTRHSGIQILFNREFVRTGLVSAEHGQLYNLLFDRRTRGDYEDFFVLTGDEVRPWLSQARDFVAAIAALVAGLPEESQDA